LCTLKCCSLCWIEEQHTAELHASVAVGLEEYLQPLEDAF